MRSFLVDILISTQYLFALFSYFNINSPESTQKCPVTHQCKVKISVNNQPAAGVISTNHVTLALNRKTRLGKVGPSKTISTKIQISLLPMWV